MRGFIALCAALLGSAGFGSDANPPRQPTGGASGFAGAR
jgi:hypothetical protein